jgi:hypothetical protein
VTPAEAQAKVHAFLRTAEDVRPRCGAACDDVCRNLVANELAHSAGIERWQLSFATTRRLVDLIFGAITTQLLEPRPAVSRLGAVRCEGGAVLVDEETLFTACLHLLPPSGPARPKRDVLSNILSLICVSAPSRRRQALPAKRGFFYKPIKMDRYFAWAAGKVINIATLRTRIAAGVLQGEPDVSP